MKKRCFIGIDVTPAVRIRVKEITDEMKKCEINVKLVEPENLHFSLKFLGSIDAKEIEKIKEVVCCVLGDQKPFKVQISKLKYHGSKRFIRNVWFDATSEKDMLFKFSSNVCEHLDSLKFVVKSKWSPKPHLTIARTRKNTNINALLDFINSHSETYVGEMLVDKVFLKESVLTPLGPKYNNVCVFLLDSR